jgi:hypothetical protein
VDIELETPEKTKKEKVAKRGKEESIGGGLQTSEARKEELEKQSEFFNEQLGLKKTFEDELANVELDSRTKALIARKQQEQDIKSTNKRISDETMIYC